MPYCGAPPLPGGLWLRWNLDPILIGALALLVALHLALCEPSRRKLALGGWAVTAFALVSPLCALSVSLFAARVGAAHDHDPDRRAAGRRRVAARDGGAPLLWPAAAAFTAFLWLWHLPAPYDATLHSDAIYWAMHTTLFAARCSCGANCWCSGAARRAASPPGTFASMQMALLGAVLTLAGRPLFAWHYTTTSAWGITPLADQQLGGVLMWVPGGLLFLWLALRHAARPARAGELPRERSSARLSRRARRARRRDAAAHLVPARGVGRGVPAHRRHCSGGRSAGRARPRRGGRGDPQPGGARLV